MDGCHRTEREMDGRIERDEQWTETNRKTDRKREGWMDRDRWTYRETYRKITQRQTNSSNYMDQLFVSDQKTITNTSLPGEGLRLYY